MLGKMGDMGKMMKQMKELKKAQKELKKIKYTVEKDSVKVTVNGEMKVLDIEIAENANITKLGKAIKDAVNDGIKKVQFESAQKLSGLAGGLNIPGLS
jgi:DNA-binding protein YbaB